MAATPTAAEVFAFIGAKTDQITTHTTMVGNLITQVVDEIQGMLGRKLTATAFTGVLFDQSVNCQILGDRLYLHGQYRDIYSITTITENGTALVAVSDYNDGGDYYLDQSVGCIIRVDGNWSLEPFAIKITGSLGIGGSGGAIDIKQAIIEIVSAKTGLWKINIETENGQIQTIKTTVPKSSEDISKRYLLLDIC